MNKIFDLIAAANRMFANPDISWEQKYTDIFALNIWQEIHANGHTFDYYDPDGSHQEDVTAYLEALNEFRGKMQGEQPIVVSLTQPELNTLKQFIFGYVQEDLKDLGANEIRIEAARNSVSDERAFVTKCKHFGIGK